MSTVLAANASGDADYVVEYPRPITAPSSVIPGSPATYATSRASRRSGWAISAIQCIDVSHQRRWRPWLGGGINVERVTDHYDQRTALFADETVTSVFAVDRQQIVIAAVAAGGIRFSVGRRVFVAGTGILHVSLGDTPFSSQPASYRLGIGIKL